MHIDPPALGAEQETNVLARMIDVIDESRLYFLQSDIEHFQTLTTGILDSNSNQACQLVDAIAYTYAERSHTVDSLTRALLNKPLPTEDLDEITLEYGPLQGFATSNDELVMQWKKWLAYELITEYYDGYAEIDSASGAELTSFDKFDKELRVQMRKDLECFWADEVTGSDYEEKVAELLFTEIAHEYDPHSTYFSPTEQRRFQFQLSSEALSYGIIFGWDDQERLIVSDISPGGPAWKSGAVYEGDLVERITTVAGAEIDITCMEPEEVMERVDFGNERTLIFHLKHGPVSRDAVKLEKGEVNVDDNTIRGFVLEGEHKVGYIALPSFYTDWSSAGGLGCANDVAKEILNLKNEGIEGLILDLRYNGGGSMSEALQLAGIFVNEGTLLITARKGEKPSLSKDPNRGTVFNAPLIVLVNGFSASASEIVAAVLQDYNRALIVGSQTYGKSTSQTIQPLLAANGRSLTNGSLGYVKVTGGIMYRIDGTSHQKIGITPDIVLPDAYSGAYDTERDKYRALEAEKINRKTYAYPLAPLPVDSIRAISQNRTSQAGSFEEVTTLNASLNDKMSMTSLPIDLASLKTYNEEVNDVYKSLGSAFFNDDSAYAVRQHALSTELSKMNAFEREITNGLQEEIGRDIYIQEAYQIMLDWFMFVGK